MSAARNYSLRPNTFERRILAVLATTKIMQGDLDYGGLLFEDVRDRLPNGMRNKTSLAAALRRMNNAGYIVTTAERREFESGIFDAFSITAIGMRVALGVLG